MKTSLLAAVLACSAFAAQAQTMLGDGAVAISQSAALAGGLTPDDQPGFPITISKAGTYRLTGNLVVPYGHDAIQIVGNIEATIDLNGFQITGSAQCAPSASCYSPTGSVGVRLSGDGGHMTVINGRIRGFSAAGIGGTLTAPSWAAPSRATVDNVRVEANGVGIDVVHVLATRVRVEGNSANGIACFHGVVSESIAVNNGGTGISLASGVVRHSQAISNRGWGFSGTAKTVFQTNSAQGNNSGSMSGGMTLPGSNAF